MQEVKRAILKVYWDYPATTDPEPIEVQYNPAEMTFDKSVQIAEVTIPGLDSPLLQYVRGQNEKLTLDLFFDTTEDGMDASAISVATKTDKIYQLVKMRPNYHAPPVCEFVWGEGGFPGSQTSSKIGGNQKRVSFKCIVESVKQKFTLFSTEGVPLRAILSVVLLEFRTLEDQLPQTNRNSPDKTNSHVLARGETLSGVAWRHYLRPSQWRSIAEENGIEDVRRLAPGTFLRLPRVQGVTS